MEKIVDTQECFSVALSQRHTQLYAYISFLVHCLRSY